MSMIIARLSLASLTCAAGLAAVAVFSSTPAPAVRAGMLAGAAGGDAERGFARFAPPQTQTPAVAACVTPDADIKFLQAIEQHMWQTWLASHPDMGGVAYQLATSWTGTQGAPTTLRWSIVPDGLFIPSGIGEPGGNSNFQAELITTYGSLEAGKEKIRQVFDRWDYFTGITFSEVGDDGAFWGAGGSPLRGDIRIGGHNFGFGDVLAYAAYPNDGDVVMNSSVNWSQPGGDYEFFRNVLAHELGHATGLQHNCPQNFTKLMEPSATVGYDGPQHDDIRGNQRHYGDRLEGPPNDSFGGATFLDVIASSDTVILPDLSIDDNSDLDFFKFVVNELDQKVTIKAKPIGYIYLQAPQASGGGCPEGISINTINIHNLNITLYDSSQVQLAFDDTSPIGFTEYLSDYELPGTGTFAVKIAGGTANGIQLYDLEILVEPVEVVPPSCPADLNDDGSVGGVDLATLLGAWSGAKQYPGCPPYTGADLNQDCLVNGLDLASLLGSWGPCK